MKNTGILPQNIVNYLSPEDRGRVRQKGSRELREAAELKDERAVQNAIANYLNLKGIWFTRSRMDKRSRNTVGTPDFLFAYRGKFVAWEVKCPWSKTLRSEQVIARDGILSQFGEWKLITGVEDAQTHLRDIDCIAAKEVAT